MNFHGISRTLLVSRICPNEGCDWTGCSEDYPRHAALCSQRPREDILKDLNEATGVIQDLNTRIGGLEARCGELDASNMQLRQELAITERKLRVYDAFFQREQDDNDDDNYDIIHRQIAGLKGSPGDDLMRGRQSTSSRDRRIGGYEGKEDSTNDVSPEEYTRRYREQNNVPSRQRRGCRDYEDSSSQDSQEEDEANQDGSSAGGTDTVPNQLARLRALKSFVGRTK
jgi:hypothetical protein